MSDETSYLSMPDQLGEVIDTIKEHMVAPAYSFHLDGMPVEVRNPEVCRISYVENLLPAPLRVRRQVTVHTKEAFIAYWERFATKDISLVFADLPNAIFVAIFDYDHVKPLKIVDAVTGTTTTRKHHAQWADHRVSLNCPHTDDWSAWQEKNDRWQSQREFSEFIEDNEPLIAEPDAATLLEMCTSFSATTNVNFKKAVRLQDGSASLTYEETTDAAAGREGTIAIPKEIVLAMQVFEGTDPVKVRARFRYKINGGALQMKYVLVRPAELARRILQEDILPTIEVAAPDAVIEGEAPDSVSYQLGN